MATPEELTAQELLRVIDRGNYAKRMLTDKIAALSFENAELMAIVDELQRDLQEARGLLLELQSSAEVESGHGAELHAIPAQQPVPGR